MTPEGRVKAALKKELARLNVYQFWPVQTGYGAATVDCLTCWAGKFIAIECKREGVEKPTPRQAAIMKEMRRFGALTYLVTLHEGELKWIPIQ
jgi:hypothetical protein